MIRHLCFLLFFFNLTLSVFGLKPDSTYITNPHDLGLAYKNLQLQTVDNAIIDVWQIFADSTTTKNTTLILAYGDSGNKSYWLYQAAILSEFGYDIVLFDYRGFGKSSEFTMNANQLYYDEFATDLSCVIHWSKEEYSKNKLGVWALSMGTIMTAIALQTESIDFLIAEGFVLDPIAIQQRIGKMKSKEIVLPESHSNYAKCLSNLQLPVLLFAGTSDLFTTVGDSKSFANSAKNRRVISFNGDHLQGFQCLTKSDFGDKYIADMDRFIRQG